ncbi:MAG: SIMPL domain-containing protein [Bacteroidia bacterium]|nr:SIMPL domain-containing protein [Bacteroidia bacterium]
MKYLFVLSLFVHIVWGQTTNLLTKTIEVTGSAEKKIIPDEFYFQLSLQEFIGKDKQKIDLTQLENKLMLALEKAGIPNSSLSIVNIEALDFRRKKKESDLLASKIFQLKLKSVTDIEKLLDGLPEDGVSRVSLVGVNHSKMSEFRKEVKIEAIKATQAKAQYLLDAIGRKLGPPQQIVELTGDQLERPYHPIRGYRETSNVISQSYLPSELSGGEETSFREIRLRYEFRAWYLIE